MVKCEVTDCIRNDNGVCDDSLYDVRIVWGNGGPTCADLQYWDEIEWEENDND